MISSNYKEQDLHLMKYVNKSIELKILRNILSTKNNTFQIKKEELKEKYKELDNINYSVWITEDNFCNKIWNFSLKHNFNFFFTPNPDITEINRPHKCEYNTIIDEDLKKSNIYNEDIVLKLKDEIDIVNNEIILIRNKNIEEDLNHHKLILDNLKSFSEEISELLRLISNPENCLNLCNTAINRKPSMIEGFMSAKKLFKKSNFYNKILIEKKFSSPSSNIIGRTKECYNIKNNIKYGRFIMKKRSLISLKFEKM